MPNYLFKSEPDAYSFADLQRDHETVWDGVTNPVAVNHLKSMKAGDRLIVYHTGSEKAAVGTAEVVNVHIEGKTPLVKIRSGKTIATPKTLASMKAEELFADSPIVRQGRLSVVPLSDAQYKWIVEG